MITIEKIRKRIIEAIKTSGKSQAEISRQINIKAPTLAQYLSGRAMPALDTFANLCAVLDVDANEILCVNEYASPAPKNAKLKERAEGRDTEIRRK